MLRNSTAAAVLFCFASAVAPAHAVEFQHEGWAIRAEYPAAPKGDEFRSPSDRGPVISERYFYETKTEAFLLLRMVHPVSFLYPQEREALYEQAKNDALHARPGEVTADEIYKLGPYRGRRFQITFKKAGRLKDLRFVLIGSSLYAISHERPAKEPLSAAGAAFLQSIALLPGYEDETVIEERDRWRRVGMPPFELRYDASRWYRDPEDTEPGIFNFFHISKKAEVQLIIERGPIPGDSLENAVLATAREGAESVNVKKRSMRLRGGVEFLDLQFEARVDGVNFVNHGRFYSGPEGSVQLRGWAIQANIYDMQGDIDELLDGLTRITPPKR
ncbi:MAG: hypothetical protein HY302_09990 [Opitutae bacterium]|nr:hypothetical protein [Opitutae bacterium]